MHLKHFFVGFLGTFRRMLSLLLLPLLMMTGCGGSDASNASSENTLNDQAQSKAVRDSTPNVRRLRLPALFSLAPNLWSQIFPILTRGILQFGTTAALPKPIYRLPVLTALPINIFSPLPIPG